MLILGRTHKQRIFIGEDIIITIFTSKKGKKTNKVQVGIEAPKSISIMREELLNA